MFCLLLWAPIFSKRNQVNWESSLSLYTIGDFFFFKDHKNI